MRESVGNDNKTKLTKHFIKSVKDYLEELKQSEVPSFHYKHRISKHFNIGHNLAHVILRKIAEQEGKRST